jgi:conjugal transfer pilus assembly protein TraB
VIEVPLNTYAGGEDGKVGVRGRLVGKQGAVLAKALKAGFLTSFAKVFTQAPSIPIGTRGSQMQFRSTFTPQAAAASGAGGAKDRLADYHMNMADCPLDALSLSPADTNCIGQVLAQSRTVRGLATAP